MLAVFDLDGTLLNTLPDIAAAANRVLSEFDMPTHGVEAYREFTGDGVVMLFRRSVPIRRDDDEQIAKCVERFFEIYGESWNQHSAPYDGIEEMLSTLSERALPLAVLSNKPQVFTDQCVAYFLGGFPFVAVYGQQDGIPHKPDPTVAIQIAAAQGVAVENCFFLGDSNVDMQTAKAAGMRAVGATWGFRTAEELTQSGADVLVDSPREFTRLLLHPSR